MIWRSLIYAILMILAKFLSGIWLRHIPGISLSFLTKKTIVELFHSRIFTRRRGPTVNSSASEAANRYGNAVVHNPTLDPTTETINCDTELSSSNEPPRTPLSLCPSFILGSAMIARGEIGFLIASTAESRYIYFWVIFNCHLGSGNLYYFSSHHYW